MKRKQTNGDESTRDDDNGILYLFGPIESGSAASLCERIIRLNVEARVPHIQLIVNSPGGSVDDGFAIVDLMEWSQIPVFTTGIGMVASMGLLVLMAGARGRRVITPRTSVLSHRYSWWAFGKHSELVAARKEQDLVHCRIVNHYVQHTGIRTEEELTRTLLRETDTWLTPGEAVRYGIVDCVQPDRKVPHPGLITQDLSRTLAAEEGKR